MLCYTQLGFGRYYHKLGFAEFFRLGAFRLELWYNHQGIRKSALRNCGTMEILGPVLKFTSDRIDE